MEFNNLVAAGAMVLLVFTLLLIAHARAHFRCQREYTQIIQAAVSAVTPEMLAERRPVVIEDRLVGDPAESLARTVFRWQHVRRRAATPCRLDAFTHTRARFTLLYFEAPTAADPSVVIRPREGDDDGDGIAVVLAVGRVLVLPPGWRFLPLASNCRSVEIDDVFSALFSMLTPR